MQDKRTLTTSLVCQLDSWTVNEAMKAWWQNPAGGWRLTAAGFEIFKQLELEHWDFETPRMVVSPGLLLALDHKLTAPYYIQVGKNSRLCFFDSREATMYGLYMDVRRFVAGLQRY